MGLKERVEAAMKRARIRSVAALARRMGVKPPSIFQVLSESRPGLGTLDAIATITGVSADWLREGKAADAPEWARDIDGVPELVKATHLVLDQYGQTTGERLRTLLQSAPLLAEKAAAVAERYLDDEANVADLFQATVRAYHELLEQRVVGPGGEQPALTDADVEAAMVRKRRGRQPFQIEPRAPAPAPVVVP